MSVVVWSFSNDGTGFNVDSSFPFRLHRQISFIIYRIVNGIGVMIAEDTGTTEKNKQKFRSIINFQVSKQFNRKVLQIDYCFKKYRSS